MSEKAAQETKMILKRSWRLARHGPSEYDVFRKTEKALFGLVRSLGSWKGGSTKLFPHRQFQDPSRESVREETFVLMENEGKPLKSAATPFELVRAILHAMIGENRL